MRTCLISLGVRFLAAIELGYEKPHVIIDKYDKLDFSFNSKAMNIILSVLVESKFIKVMHFKATHEMWDKLRNIHEGDDNVRMARLEVYIMHFESLRMSDDEYIEKLFLQVDEMVNVMKGLYETVEQSYIFQKVLRSLPTRSNCKVSAIEEMYNIETLIMDQFIGSLKKYNMIITKGKPTSRKETFKVERKSTKYHEC